MNRRAPLVCFLITALAGGIFAPTIAAQEVPPITWRYDYQSARKEALEKNLPLMIDFGTTNCFHCRRQDETTLRDPQIVRLVAKQFIALKIDGEVNTQLTQALRISLYPTIVLATPDGRILNSLEGFQEVGQLQEKLHRALATLAPPEWMQRDLNIAKKAFDTKDYPRAISLLRAIVEDGKNKPVQGNARKLLDEIEEKAQERLVKAKELRSKGSMSDIVASLTDTIQQFPGITASREASELLAQLAKNVDVNTTVRTRKARVLLNQARDYYNSKDYLLCFDRCEILTSKFGDLTEGQEAGLLIHELNTNPDWQQTAADTLIERFASVTLAQAETAIKRGQVERAEFHLQRVIQLFPGTRYAESAQLRLNQIMPEQAVRGDQSTRP